MFKGKFLATATIATLAITFWLPITPTQLAVAATSCTNSAGKSGSIIFSSKVRTSSVVLCGDWAKVTKPSAPTVPKKIVTKPLAQPIKQSPGSTIVYTHSVIAAPTKPKITASQNGLVQVASYVTLKSVAPSVIRYRYLLGIPTQIKFTPVAYFWRLSDGKTSKAKNLRHLVSDSGQLSVNLKVGYAVGFRLATGGAWRPFDRTVSLNASPIRLNAATAQGEKLKLRYVLFNCLQRPTAPGCSL